MAEPNPVYTFAEYPKSLYRKLKSRIVAGKTEEDAAAKAGWLTADKRTAAELPPEVEDLDAPLDGE